MRRVVGNRSFVNIASFVAAALVVLGAWVATSSRAEAPTSAATPHPRASGAAAVDRSLNVSSVVTSSPASSDDGSETSSAESPPMFTIDYDPSRAPVIPSGGIRQYVARYYDAIENCRLEKAFAMVKSNDRGGFAGFKARQAKGYDTVGYSVVATVPVTPTNTRLFVAQRTASDGAWTVIWDFLQTKRGTILSSLTYTRTSQFACH